MTARNWVQQLPTMEAYWIDRVLYDVQHDPDHSARFRADPDGYLSAVPLPDSAKRDLKVNDIGRLYLWGSNPYLLRTHCLQLQVPEAEYLAALRAVGGQDAIGHLAPGEGDADE